MISRDDVGRRVEDAAGCIGSLRGVIGTMRSLPTRRVSAVSDLWPCSGPRAEARSGSFRLERSPASYGRDPAFIGEWQA